MILTCPTCASRYRIDETKLGPQGRTVRCAACGESWRAEPAPEPLQLTPDPFSPALAPADPVGPDSVAPNPFTEAVAGRAEPDLAETPAEELPKVFRQKAQAKRRTREAITAGLVWGGMAAGLALLLLAAVVFRVRVVELWPRTAGAYAAVHLTVNPLGVAPDNVHVAPGLENGRAALIVTGAERNIDSRPRGPVPLRISLYDKAGARLLSRIVDLPAPPLGGGESRSFRVSFLDPPMAAAQVGVDFATPAGAPGRSPRAATRPPRLRGALSQPVGAKPIEAPSADPRLRGEITPVRRVADGYAPLPPVAARPISATSPYALPSAARAETD
jgi:predicted Zn finger-like uncharacterized protein